MFHFFSICFRSQSKNIKQEETPIDTSAFFESHKASPVKRVKANPKDIPIKNEEEDVIVVDDPPAKPHSRISKRSSTDPTPVTKKTEIQPAPKKATKKDPPKPRTAIASSDSGSTSTAEKVLASIPDAILPDIDPDKKYDFRQFMTGGGHNASSGMSQQHVSVPEARENCLAGLKIVFTGVLPHLNRDECNGIAKRYGAEVPKTVSKKTSVVVLGADAGPAKIKKITELGIKVIDEDGFLQLLRDMPAAGGSGELAHKAMLKKQAEEAKIAEETRKMEEELKAHKKKLQKEAVMSALNSGSSGSQRPVSSSNSVSLDHQLWTTKYAPTNTSQIIGNPGAVKKLETWLSKWEKNRASGFKKPGPDGSGCFRAVMIHGPPGIGKTTAAHLVSKLLGFDVLENNASDTRSKSLLAAKVTSTIQNRSLNGYFKLDGKEPDAKKKKLVLIMDEVDGMSGGDRGGVGQMAALCRTTNIPIILICNDRSLPKMRPFDKVTFELPFRRATVDAARVRIMSIARSEKLNLEPGVVDQLVQSTQSDIRQIINILSTFSRTRDSLGSAESATIAKAWEKHTVLKPFDIVGRLLNGGLFSENSRVTLNEKIDLYFHDHDFTPLMVQENYLNTTPAKTGANPKRHLEAVLKAANSIADGDLVDARIHSSELQWSLMPLHAVLSSVRPASFIAGSSRTRYNFTSYLGNNSKRGKYDRLLQELHSHMRLLVSANKQEIRNDYLTLLAPKLLIPLVKSGAEGVPEIIEFMDDYYLTREDWDVIMELGVAPRDAKRSEDVVKSIPAAVKSSFTRKYNTSSHPVPFMKSASSLKAIATSSSAIPDLEETLGEEIIKEEEDEQKEEDDDDDITKDKYIKVAKPKKKPAAKASKTSSATKAAPKPRSRKKAATK